LLLPRSCQILLGIRLSKDPTGTEDRLALLIVVGQDLDIRQLCPHLLLGLSHAVVFSESLLGSSPFRRWQLRYYLVQVGLGVRKLGEDTGLVGVFAPLAGSV